MKYRTGLLSVNALLTTTVSTARVAFRMLRETFSHPVRPYLPAFVPTGFTVFDQGSICISVQSLD
jgi:hypothetical protein